MSLVAGPGRDPPTGGGRTLALSVSALVLLLVEPTARLVLSDPEPVTRRSWVLTAAAVAVGLLAFLRLTPTGRRRAAAVVLAAVAALLVSEGILRLTLADAFAPLYRPHPDWLYEQIPGARHVFVSSAEGAAPRVVFDVSKDGFRGAALREPGTAKRVVVYGDSFIAATATPESETYPARLAEELGRGEDMEVVNAGVVGYGPDQILLRMEDELPRLHPDLAVVAILAENDYGDLLRNRIFELSPQGTLTRRHPAVWRELPQFEDVTSGRFLTSVVLENAVERFRSALFDPPAASDPGETERWLGACEFGYRLARQGGDAPVADLFLDHPDEDVRVEPQRPSAQHKVRFMERILAEIAATAARHRVPLVFVVIPAAIDVCDDYDRDRVDTARYPLYRPTNLTQPIERALDAAGASHVDLYGPFRSAGASSLYLRGGDTHWNAAGQALAARITAAFIRERRVLGN